MLQKNSIDAKANRPDPTEQTASTKKLLVLPFISVLISLIAQLFIAIPARAECLYEGQRFETGQTVGPYVCTPDGTWQQR